MISSTHFRSFTNLAHVVQFSNRSNYSRCIYFMAALNSCHWDYSSWTWASCTRLVTNNLLIKRINTSIKSLFTVGRCRLHLFDYSHPIWYCSESNDETHINWCRKQGNIHWEQYNSCFTLDSGDSMRSIGALVADLFSVLCSMRLNWTFGVTVNYF